MNNRLRVLMAIEFKRFMYAHKKIDTLRDYVTFFYKRLEEWISENFRCMLWLKNVLV